MNITGSIALVTGANGGIGRAFVDDLLKRGTTKIYVATRDTASLAELLKDGDSRLDPLALDVTNPDQVAAAASAAKDVTLLINNASVSTFEGVIAAPDMDAARYAPLRPSPRTFSSIADSSAQETEGAIDRVRQYK